MTIRIQMSVNIARAEICRLLRTAPLEPRYVSARPWDEVAQDAAVYIVSPDADLSATRLVHVEQALAEPRPAGDTMEAERQRLSAAVWGSRRPLVVSWLPEPESPLFGHTPPPVRSADIQIYVTAAARLPLTVSRHARGWFELVINGGPSGLDRALREIDQTQRLGAVALAGLSRRTRSSGSSRSSKSSSRSATSRSKRRSATSAPSWTLPMRHAID